MLAKMCGDNSLSRHADPVSWKPLVALFVSPAHFLRWAPRVNAVLGWVALPLLIGGLIWALAWAPTDARQGESYRILFVHAPSAMLAEVIYFAMGVAGLLYIIWRIKLAPPFIAACAPVGTFFAVLVLLSGMLWGRDTWGTAWLWNDPRLLSTLVLVFFYLGILALMHSRAEAPARMDMPLAVLALVGTVNLPFVRMSVVWWQSIHQQASFRITDTSVDPIMLWPFALCTLGLFGTAAWIALTRMQWQLLLRSRPLY